jgi:hypothetical protein
MNDISRVEERGDEDPVSKKHKEDAEKSENCLLKH